MMLLFAVFAGNTLGQSPVPTMAMAESSYNLIQADHSLNCGKWNNDYQVKARKQKIAAWALAGAGAGMIIAGIIVGSGDSDDLTDAIGDTLNGGALIATGAVLGMASVPLFIIAGKNKRKAGVSGHVNIQPLQVFAMKGNLNALQPSISVGLSF